MAESAKTASMFTLPSDLEIAGTRILDGPPELVYKAYTDPEIIPQWWGPRRYTTTIDKLQVRPGGAWRFVHRAAGEEHAFNGVFREVVPGKRLVMTFNYEGAPGHEAVQTLTFEAAEGGKTRVTELMRFNSRDERDGMIRSGMEEGAAESVERLRQVLKYLQSPQH
jgi:uncharacterized protein YndB with AHSA1/START domain